MKSLYIVKRNNPANAQAKVMKKRSLRYLILPGMLVASFLAFTFGVSSQSTVFGPRTYTRTPGPLDIFQDNFSVLDVNSGFTLLVQNGDGSGNLRVSGAEISLNGVAVVRDKDFSQPGGFIQKTVSLLENNTIQVQLRSSPPGTFITIEILRNPLPNLSITSPISGTVFSAQPITVEGTINIASSQVTVNGVRADVTGGRFVANNVPLPRDGNNIITATGTTPGGSTGQASIMVVLDRLPPAIVIDGPRNSLITDADTIEVTGMVRDVITPTPTVMVNGIQATVNNGSFVAAGIPLILGANKITATATDQVGNQNSTAITVHRAELPGLRLRILSGQAQNGPIGTTLPAPLTVQLQNVDGDPVPNRELLFQVSRGDGTIKNSPPVPGQTAQRTLNILTDANGEAAVRFTLGTRTGAGNNRVEASVAGGLSPIDFCATATGGAPDRIAIIPMSNQQTGVINQPLAMPYACVVVNASGNPVAGVPVLFRVTEGGGSFGGNVTVTEPTGPDGVAHALMTLGPEPGTQNNAATAAFQGQTDPPIVFAASGRAPGPLGNTTFSGLVLDNGDRPLRNARAVILGTNRSALTDETGRFLITNVPPGPQLLFIDGAAIADSQKRIFPNLEFDLNVISGVENSLPMPIYLPPLATDPQSVATITGPVTTPIVLKMPGVPESTLTLLPGTIVSNHTGQASASNPITVRLSRVNNDRVPMPPPNGSVFTLAGTVQPAGTHFNPPAKICAPNTGMPPGAQVNIFSFDHDVGQFLSIGFATVSEDGSAVCSNPGFGIDKAGWFGGTPPPPPSTDPKNCRVFLTASRTRSCVGEQVTFVATTDPPGRSVTFGGDQGINPVQNGNTLTTTYNSVGQKTITARCGQPIGRASVDVYAVTQITLDRPESRTTFCVGETGDFTARLSMPFSGVPIIFEVINLADNSIFTSVTRATNSQGQATVTLEATTVGRYNVRARCGGEAQAPSYGPIQVVRLVEAQAKRNDESDDVFSKDPGRFCVGDQINGRARSDPDMPLGDPIKWELRLGGFFGDTVRARGVGNSFNNQDVDERGTWKIIFYCDSNGNGQFDDPLLGDAEPNVQTEDFTVQDMVVIDLTVGRHVDIPAASVSNATVDAIFAEANRTLRRRDRASMDADQDDTRSCVQLRRSGNVGTFSGVPSDIVTEADQDAVFGVGGFNIKIVNTINFCGDPVSANGCTLRGNRNTILRVGVVQLANASTWAHEFGHAQGIAGDYQDEARSHRIMFFQFRSGRNTVDRNEADRFRSN